MALQPNIDYKIRLNNGDSFLIKIQLADLEKFGLLQCLKDNDSFENEEEEKDFEVTFRKIHLTPFDPKYQEKKKEDVVSGNFVKKEYDSDKPYRVHMKSVKSFEGADVPEFIDVDAVSPPRAVVRALHKMKIFDFPKDWRDIKVTSLQTQKQ